MSDVGIAVTGIPIGRVSGCTLSYSHGAIPVALVEFDPTTGDQLIAGMNGYRRTPVSISVNSTLGTLTFDGFFDGLSFSQTPGGYSYSAVIKNNFQLLNYIYPMNLGLNPLSKPLNRVDLSAMLEDDDSNGLLDSFAGVQFEEGENIVEFFLKVVAAIIDFQNDPGQLKAALDAVDYTNLQKLLENPAYKQTLTKAKALMASINTDAVAAALPGDTASAGSKGLGWIGSVFNGNPATLWDVLMSGLAYLGCTLIVGNSIAYVVPENTFVAIPQPGDPAVSQKSSSPNIVFPAQMTSLSFNDNGFKDIGYTILLANDRSNMSENGNGFVQDAGFFEDKAKGASAAGVLVVSPPPFLSDYFSDIIVHKNGAPIRKQLGQGNGNGLTTKVVTDVKAEQAKATAIQTSGRKVKEEARGTLDRWAQIKYLQAKYGDRGGSVTMEFNPNFCPGTGGLAYIRSPGMYVDFFVDTVSHQFAVAAGNSGKAITAINFSSGRLSNDTPGVANDEMYLYDYAKMSKIQSAFISDIS